MSLDLSFLSSDPLLYFLAHSTLFVVVVAAVFFVFGLIFGWCTWGRYKRQRRDLMAECESMKNEIAKLKRHLAEQTNKLAAQAEPAAAAGASGRRNAHADPDPVLDSFLSTAAAILPKVHPEVDGPARIEAKPDAAPVEPASEPVITGGVLDMRPPERAPAHTPVPARKPSAGLNPFAHVLQSLVGPIDELDLTDKPGGDKSLPPPVDEEAGAEEPAHEPAGAPAAASVPEPDEAGVSASASDAAGSPPSPPSGEAVNSEPRLMSDPHLGLIYASRPGLADDLAHLKGVAATIEGKLHDLGVYTFKQIALWSDENVHEFSRLLSFKDRIRRERWVEQARELHFQKYGERL
ncbi:MAG: hypothetical protein K1X78_27085 [Verrucomicrobiaceae bacterium]|nr:hypothetical protein [Verrucomicrobiaceae bacterium]